MRVTGTGHAGMRFETTGGSVLCDPWTNPTFFASWVPFPDNTGLDWAALGQCDYLYVSHLHRDHFDAENLRRNVSKDARVLLPDFPTDELENELRDLGFRHFVRTRSGEPIDLDGGLRVMVTSLKGPGDGPIGDSALSLDDGTARIVNQNDAHPLDIPELLEFGAYDAHFTQFSGAIWWPMVYDLPTAAKREFARRKRIGQEDRAMRYIREVGAPNIFPTAGPPCFLDDELFRWNGLGYEGVENESIFTDQWEFLGRMRELGHDGGHLLLPGTTAEIDGPAVRNLTHPMSDAEVERIFVDKESYLREFAERARPVIEAQKAAWSAPQPDILRQLKEWIEPLMKRADHMCDGIGGVVRMDLTGMPAGAPGVDDDGVLPLAFDFAGREIRTWDGEQARYRWTIPATLVQTNIDTGEVDWSNSLFLSVRFAATRVGQYNEYLYTFFKCLSEERMDYVENWYDAANDDGRDIELDGWKVQARCPHLSADLSKFGAVDGDVLTCTLHNWKFNLATGRCLTSAGHEIRAEKLGASD
ncbi:MBL fold metallo-hydrolase [Actinomycetospora corticicola]|uniref:UDP-MurNAc hydroxylase n=1 Tax=Actinomycetospora corticicola TaxID=663602 RepID=A0A7Y9DZ38_9PSEU|nr:UDP-MurNAc hydroxylase [Actinomycetospora corticicola]